MDFSEYPLLNYPHLMLTILKTASGGETTLRRCVEGLRESLAFAQEQPPVADDEICQRMDRARLYLLQARLVTLTDGDRFRVTGRGREVLANHPMGFDNKVLMEFPEFREFMRQSAGTAPTPADPLTAPTDEGYAAYRSGRKLADNPHEFDTVDHLAWEDGWFAALDDDREQQGR